MDILKNIWNFIVSLTAEQITLISIAVSFLIYLLGKNNETRLRKHELKKEHYIKILDMFNKIFADGYKKDKKGDFIVNKDLKAEWFDMGSSLFVYGSKRLYKMYVFYRSFSENPFYKKSKYMDSDINIFLMAEIFNQIRKEVSLSFLEFSSGYDALAFFVNDIANDPSNSSKYSKYRFKVKMLKLETFFIKIITFSHIKKIYYMFIAPVIGFIRILFKYLILIPLGKLLMKIFPKFAKRLAEEQENKADEPA